MSTKSIQVVWVGFLRMKKLVYVVILVQNIVQGDNIPLFFHNMRIWISLIILIQNLTQRNGIPLFCILVQILQNLAQ